MGRKKELISDGDAEFIAKIPRRTEFRPSTRTVREIKFLRSGIAGAELMEKIRKDGGKSE